jgi:peptidoglycan/LPS O-acetylase OafA/YrhL
MHPLSPFFAIIIYSIVFLTAYLFQLKYKIISNTNRFETIDGLRGSLAIGVFIHHATIWHQYLKIGKWQIPNSNLYVHLGQTTVALFFMITAFLFISKLFDEKLNSEFNWKLMFVSRIFRLTPMYFISTILMLFFIMVISNFEIKVDVTTFLKSMFYWFTFTFITSRNINGYELTSLLNAGVNWSLPFEWMFYLSLPIISIVIMKTKPSKIYIFSCLFCVVSFFVVHGINFFILSSFLGGAITAIIKKYGKPNINYNSNFVNCVVLILIVSILQFKTADNYICKFFIVLLFMLIAFGNSIFGILKNNTLKFLGEISYSTYLLHGLLLFYVFYFGFGFEKLKKFTPQNYSFLVFAISPVVVIISFIGFKFIEKPSMVFFKKHIL